MTKMLRTAALLAAGSAPLMASVPASAAVQCSGAIGKPVTIGPDLRWTYTASCPGATTINVYTMKWNPQTRVYESVEGKAYPGSAVNGTVTMSLCTTGTGHYAGYVQAYVGGVAAGNILGENNTVDFYPVGCK